VAGYPPIPGATVLAKRRHALARLDHLRRLLMFEPRGSFDMYGVIPVAPDPPSARATAADLAALFMHNEGLSISAAPLSRAIGGC
jgi:proline racemase